jgi:UDP-glucose 4-epimerase
MSNKVLVTGGLGFVGSNLVDRLVSLGFDVDVIDNLSSESSSKDYCNPNANYYFVDVVEISNSLSGKRYDKIFHLAAEARIQPSFENPVKWFESNAVGTLRLMEFAHKSCSGIVVYSTTSSKNHGSIFITPYTYSKVVGEGILKMYSQCYDVNCAMATFYNVYGNREPEIGDWATVVAKFLRQRKNGEKITIVGDGQQSRDFTSVNDICDGLIKISEGNWKADNFDLGRGEPIKIIELANLISGGDSNAFEFVPLRKGEGLHTLSDWKSTLNKLNWRAQQSLIDYIKNNIQNV